jgi:hypothetical protein
LIGQVNAKNGAVADKIIKEEVKVTGQQMSVTNFVHKNWYLFCSKKLHYSKGGYGIRWYYYKSKVQIHTPQFCLFFPTHVSKYSISHTI